MINSNVKKIELFIVQVQIIFKKNPICNSRPRRDFLSIICLRITHQYINYKALCMSKYRCLTNKMTIKLITSLSAFYISTPQIEYINVAMRRRAASSPTRSWHKYIKKSVNECTHFQRSQSTSFYSMRRHFSSSHRKA